MLGYRYPAQFDDHIFEGADGERIAATIALQEAARPALIVVHGLFTSSRFDYVRQIAVRAYYEWGFNVAAIDLRSFGMTELTTPAPSTGGWKEGEDIARPRPLHEGASAATSVGALGISLGASSVLNACHLEGPTTALDGGILAVSPPADPAGGLGAALRAGAARPSPLPAPHGVPGGADLARALRPLARGRRPRTCRSVLEHDRRARTTGSTAEEIWRNATAARPRRRTPRSRCWSSTPRTT